jgi:hypothetical protein
MANFNITVAPYSNQAPTVGDGQRNANYGEDVTFTRADFTTNTTPPYSDPEGDSPLTLRIDSLPLSGILKLNGAAVAVNQEIDFVSEIDTGLLKYTPDLNNTAAHDTDFNFSIADAGSGVFTS